MDKQREKRTVTIRSEEYEIMAKALTHYVREIERQNTDGFAGVKQSDMMTWYVSNNMYMINNMDDLRDTQKILRAILNRLISEERTFIVASDDKNVDERLLKLHPNHYMD